MKCKPLLLSKACLIKKQSELIRLTLVSRSYCHLCDEMVQALKPFAHEFGLVIDVQDVDATPELLLDYDELVPVLLHEGKVLCHYRLDAEVVRQYLKTECLTL